MNGKLIVILFSVMFGCSSIKSEKNLISQNPEGNLSPLEVMTALTKFHYVNGGDFEFKIFPITKSYILSELNQLNRIRGLDEKEKENFIKSREDQYTKNATCAFFEMSSINTNAEESLQNWNITIASNLGGIYPVRFPASSVRTFSNLFRGLRGTKEKWTSYGIGCSRVKVPIENGFTIILKRLDDKGTHSPQSKVTWGK